MGGYGSTRWEGVCVREVLENASLALDVRAFADVLNDRLHEEAPCTISNLDGRPIMSGRLYPFNGVRRGLKVFCKIGWNGAALERLDDHLQCFAIRQPYGGFRWRYQCAGCRKTRMRLYLLRYPKCFRCRECANLAYYCQRLGKVDAARRQMEKIALSIRITYDEDIEALEDGRGFPLMKHRPNGMHRSKYRALRVRLHNARERLWDRDCEHLARGLAKIDRMMARFGVS